MNKPFDTEFRTVVFQVTDPDKFNKVWSDFCNQMATNSEVNGCRVTGVSYGDMFKKVEELEEELLWESWR